MEDWMCPADAVCPEEPTCMECGKVCSRTEVVWTGDSESYAGFELWCYCEDCQTDTFHRMVKDENSKYDELLERFQKQK